MQNTQSVSLVKSVFLAFRPKTLTAALVPCVAASALAWKMTGDYSGWALTLALLASFAIQIGTNLVNDAVDFKKGADTEKRLGPQRITQAGILSPKQVMLLGTLFFALAIAFGIPLVQMGGWPIVIVGLVSVAMGYAYTAGPFPLAYRGLGDLFVVIFFGLVAVGGMFYLHTGSLSEEALVLGLQIGLHATVLIAINNLRDHEGDRLVNKRTLAVRLGVQGARFEIFLLAFLPFFINFYWYLKGWEMAAVLPLFVVWLAERIAKGIYRNEPGALYNKFLGMSAGLHLLFGLLWSVGALL